MRAARRETAARRSRAARRAQEQAAAERREVREALERRAAALREQNTYLRDPCAEPPPARKAFLTRARPLMPSRGRSASREGARGGSVGPAPKRPPQQAGLRAFIKQRRAEAGGKAAADEPPSSGVTWAGKWSEARENADLDLEKILDEQCAAAGEPRGCSKAEKVGGDIAPGQGSRYGVVKSPQAARAHSAMSAAGRGRPNAHPVVGDFDKAGSPGACQAPSGPPTLRRGCVSTARHRARPVDIFRDSLEMMPGDAQPQKGPLEYDAPPPATVALKAPGPKMAWWCTGMEADLPPGEGGAGRALSAGSAHRGAPPGSAKVESKNKIRKKEVLLPHRRVSLGETGPVGTPDNPADMSLSDIVSRKETSASPRKVPPHFSSGEKLPSPKKARGGKPGIELWVPSSPSALVQSPGAQKKGAAIRNAGAEEGKLHPQQLQPNPAVALACPGRQGGTRPVSEQGCRRKALFPPVQGAKPRATSAVPSRRPVRPEGPLTCEGSYVSAQKERERRENLFQVGAGEMAVARQKRREDKLRSIQGYTESFLHRPPDVDLGGSGGQEEDILASLQRLDNFLARKNQPALRHTEAAQELTNSMEQRMLQSSLMRLDARLEKLSPHREREKAEELVKQEMVKHVGGETAPPSPKAGRVLVCATNTFFPEQRSQRYGECLQPAVVPGGQVPLKQRRLVPGDVHQAPMTAVNKKKVTPVQSGPWGVPKAHPKPPRAPSLARAPGLQNIPAPHGRGGIQHQEQRPAAGTHCGDSGGRILVSSAIDWRC